MNTIESIKRLWSEIAYSVRNYLDYRRGHAAVEQLPDPRLTIFGSSLLSEDDYYSVRTFELANTLARKGWSVITGGGPGIMQAGNCGAEKVNHSHIPRSIGIGVKGVDEEFENKCSPVIHVNLFSTRKNLLTHFSKAFIFMPGGIGTADELFDLLNSFKHVLIPHAPIVLFGTDYWKPLVDWYTHAVAAGYIKQDNAHLFLVTDEVDTAVSYICAYGQELPERKR